MQNHEMIAGRNPDAYRGWVKLVSGETWPVARAANYFDLPPLVRRFSQWAISAEGLECLVTDYSISRAELYRDHWIDQIAEKRWADLADFEKAYEAAIEHFDT